ncbi:MAG: hypothetical protein IKU26_00135 [Clostridia bacterium]|nr:hypothetical protein [Clostridia bacterium]
MDWLQEGYYPLKTPEGRENGYLCLNFLSEQLEILVVIDQAPASQTGFTGCFTTHLAVKRSGLSWPFPACAIPGRYRGRCAMVKADQVFPEGSVDYTLFNGEKPIASAVLYTAPEPILQPEPEPEPKIEPTATYVSEQETADSLEMPLSLTPFDPFNTTNNAYEWWLCGSNDEFHQLMAQTGLIPHPPLYTALQSALVRFGHFIFGRYTEENNGRNLLILGVPGRENTAQEPGNSRWISAQNKITGVMDYTGYNLHYFDGQTGKSIRAIVRQ